MKPHYLQHLVLVLLGLLTACTPPESSPTVSPTPAAQPSNALRPDTRVVPIRVDGNVTELELKLFNQPSLPFTTYVPAKDFANEVGSSDEGTGVRFYFSPKGVKDENTYIHIFVPAHDTSLEGMQDLILGDQGLLVSNGWELIDRTSIVSYPWVREKLIYRQRTAKQTFIGAIYIGDYNDRAFYAFTHYPQDRTSSFDTESTIVLENLQFKADR